LSSRVLPIFPLQVVVFPGERIPLHIFEERYKEMTRNCLSDLSTFGMVCVLDGGLARVGCEISIDEVITYYDDGRFDLNCSGITRFEILRTFKNRSYYEADVVPFADKDDKIIDLRVYNQVYDLYKEMVTMAAIGDSHSAPENPVTSFDFAHFIGFDLRKKQQILELKSETERFVVILEHLKEMLPRVHGYESVRNRIRNNGFFRNFPSIDINLK
jgi:Lon protease-like protein